LGCVAPARVPSSTARLVSRPAQPSPPLRSTLASRGSQSAIGAYNGYNPTLGNRVAGCGSEQRRSGALYGLLLLCLFLSPCRPHSIHRGSFWASRPFLLLPSSLLTAPRLSSYCPLSHVLVGTSPLSLNRLICDGSVLQAADQRRNAPYLAVCSDPASSHSIAQLLDEPLRPIRPTALPVATRLFDLAVGDGALDATLGVAVEHGLPLLRCTHPRFTPPSRLRQLFGQTVSARTREPPTDR